MPRFKRLSPDSPTGAGWLALWQAAGVDLRPLYQATERSQQFEKAVFVALRFQADASQVERDFGVQNLYERVTRIQIAEMFGWSLDYIDSLRIHDLYDVQGYLAGNSKAQSIPHPGRR